MGTGSKPSRIAIARIARTRGNRGEVLAELYTDFPARFEALEDVWLEAASGECTRATLEGAWEHRGRVVLKFVGYDSISAAEALVGSWVTVDSCDEVQPPPGAFFDHELVGCRVQDTRGQVLGEVSDVLRIPGNHLLVITGAQGEVLIPVSESICRTISVERREIVVDPPEGLLDLNR